NERLVLPVTKYDDLIDRESENVGGQIFEKMISGMYLGDIVRHVLLDMVSNGELFNGKSSAELRTKFNFDTAYMSRIERYAFCIKRKNRECISILMYLVLFLYSDHSGELSDTKALLEDLMKITPTTIEDR